MTVSTPPPSVEELRALEAAATKGPWSVKRCRHLNKILHSARGRGDDYNNRIAETFQWSPSTGPQTDEAEAFANAALIVAMRNALPGILSCTAKDKARIVELEAGLREIAGNKGTSGTWAEVTEPLVTRFDIAAKFNGDAVHNAEGAMALAELLRSMAAKLDIAASRADALLTPTVDPIIAGIARQLSDGETESQRTALPITPTVSREGQSGWLPIETFEDQPHGQANPVIIAAGNAVGEAWFRDPDGANDSWESGWWWAGTGPGEYACSPVAEINDAPSRWMPLPAPPQHGEEVA